MTTMVTLDAELKLEETLFKDTRRQLQDLRDDIERYREDLAVGDADGLSKHCPEIKRLTNLLHICSDVENRLGEARNRKRGIVQNGVAFDLDAARDTIGRKLDKLRACACSD